MYHVMKDKKEYWVKGGGETAVWSVRANPKGGFDIVREAWGDNDPEDAPTREEVVSNHKTRLGAAQKMGRLLKPFMRS